MCWNNSRSGAELNGYSPARVPMARIFLACLSPPSPDAPTYLPLPLPLPPVDKVHAPLRPNPGGTATGSRSNLVRVCFSRAHTYKHEILITVSKQNQRYVCPFRVKQWRSLAYSSCTHMRKNKHIESQKLEKAKK